VQIALREEPQTEKDKGDVKHEHEEIPTRSRSLIPRENYSAWQKEYSKLAVSDECGFLDVGLQNIASF
jgi:hypothetical protein